MKKQYLSALTVLALFFGIFFTVSAQSVDFDYGASVQTRPIQAESSGGLNVDFMQIYNEQKSTLEAQRQRMRAEAQALKTAAEARGDDLQAKRAALILELETKRADADARREAIRAQAEVLRAKVETRADFEKDTAMQRVEHTITRILAVIDHLEKIIVRIESRIAKIKAGGGATVEAEGFVAKAKVNLRDARLAVDGFASIDLAGDDALEKFQGIRAAAARAREHIRAAHRNLMLAVRSLSSVEVRVISGAVVE